MNNPTPQQNQNVAPQQKVDSEVMALIKRKGQPQNQSVVDQAKENLKQAIIQYKIDPQKIIYAGKLAKQAARNPEMYQMAIQTALKQGLIQQKDIKKSGVDYELLANGITAGKLAEQLVKEGAV